ncbi:IS30 family transposase [Tsukamurella sp. PLM1]|nr:IS30 family transposase [Tsukamurella sp. PLM1]
MCLVGRPKSPAERERPFWDQIRSGKTVASAAAGAGVSERLASRWFNDRGGMKPAIRTGEPSYRRLDFAEREEIALLRADRLTVRAIADRLGRSPSTISRELRRAGTFIHGRTVNGRRYEYERERRYRASTAQAAADAAACRTVPGKLASNPRLQQVVQQWLEDDFSPEQISNRLRVEFPDDPEMRVSDETIYKALYVQGRGELRRELTTHLRTGRKLRKPQRSNTVRNRIPNMVNISERPKDVEDRAIPGDWEGDLILGSTASGSAIGTLVERATGFVMLLHLPGDHTAETVAAALIDKIGELPEQLQRSLTWDQGIEMTKHELVTAATGIDIYFCDPRSPWQRGSNENTNGLLRQYFPKGTDLSQWGPGYLDLVAAQLNRRPRKRLDWHTPAEALDRLLSEQAA